MFSDTAQLPQALVHIGYLVAGVQATVVQSTPTSVSISMGPVFNVGWIVLLIAGPVLTFAGGMLRDRYKGLILQIAALVAIECALAAYVAAISERAVIGEALFSIWVVSALMVVEAVVIVRKARQVRKVVGLARRLPTSREEG